MTAVHFLHSTLQQCHRLNTFANLLCAVFRISQQKAKFWTKAAKNPGAGYTVIFFPRLRVTFTIIRRGDSDQSFDGRQCLIFRHRMLHIAYVFWLFCRIKASKEVGVVIGRVQCLHEIQHNVGNKTYTNLACFESCFCSGVELAMTKNFSVRRNHSLVVGEITFQVTYTLLYCRIINIVLTSRHVSVV